jgi:hypothetical protein
VLQAAPSQLDPQVLENQADPEQAVLHPLGVFMAKSPTPPVRQ